MRSTIAVALLATVMLAGISTASAEDKAPSKKPNAAPSATAGKDAKADDSSGIISLEKGIAAPYRACINARGWVNGRLVCGD